MTQKLKNAWAWLLRVTDGKKTAIGAIVTMLPSQLDQLAAALNLAGLDAQAAAVIRYAGLVLVAAGVIHKIVKWLDDRTPEV